MASGTTHRFKVVLLGEGKDALDRLVHRSRREDDDHEQKIEEGMCTYNADTPSSSYYIGRVGKTSILLRYVRGEYDDKQQSTIQVRHGSTAAFPRL